MNIEPDALKQQMPSSTSQHNDVSPRGEHRQEPNALFLNKSKSINSSWGQMEHNPITVSGSQWRQGLVDKQIKIANPGQSVASKPLRIAVPMQNPRLVLVGDRHMLRALRAAEMAAWNARPPVTRNSFQGVSPQINKPSRLPALPVQRNESLLLALLGLAALASVCIGMRDMNALLMGWSHMVNGIHSLLL